MVNFKVYDVKADGNCYYRCIYNIAKHDPYIQNALSMNNINDEDESVREIREYVSLSLKNEEPPKIYLQNLLELYRAVPDIKHQYPLLETIDIDEISEELFGEIADKIENTNMMASSFEHEVVSTALYPYLYIIVIKKTYRDSVEDLADKWLHELHKMLPTITCERVAIIINEDDIHYKYMKFQNNVIINRLELVNHVQEKINATKKFKN
jgi:hypothetical protein